MDASCPTCGGPVDAAVDPRHRPFCSSRCQLVDLGRWLGEEYVIPGEPVDVSEHPEASGADARGTDPTRSRVPG